MKYIERYPVHVEPFHCDYTDRLFMSVLGNHLLNAADKHSTARGWGIGKINGIRHTWVLSRLSIELTQSPVRGQHLAIDTWVESVMRLFTTRNFAILDSEGTPVGYARSVWAMIDMETRKPCDLLTLYDGDILNYVIPEDLNNCPIDGHGRYRFRQAQPERTIQTYYSDVDINGHVNSIRYIEHILNLFPMEDFRSGIRRFEIAYKTESYVGDHLTLYRQDNPDGSIDIEVRKGVGTDTPGEVVCQSRVIFNNNTDNDNNNNNN